MEKNGEPGRTERSDSKSPPAETLGPYSPRENASQCCCCTLKPRPDEMTFRCRRSTVSETRPRTVDRLAYAASPVRPLLLHLDTAHHPPLQTCRTPGVLYNPDPPHAFIGQDLGFGQVLTSPGSR
ncbi:hypothetical protein AAFF_G00359480 [Aldrovandia affinis]|uniref:Uncharacterized protein n=1 Tax=Aldrovandia affinis TaxID=143900 RepID=A0AAD7WN50_9TELE|nr:hypothetical protein AAFF_G00359480 [Aldrovandia affinis]